MYLLFVCYIYCFVSYVTHKLHYYIVIFNFFTFTTCAFTFLFITSLGLVDFPLVNAILWNTLLNCPTSVYYVK